MKVLLRLFALYRERAGAEEVMLELPDGAKVEDLLACVRGTFPKLHDLPSRVLVAVNLDYASPDQVLCSGDEVALIPPVAGGSGNLGPHIRIVTDPIQPSLLLEKISTHAAGAQVLFLGTVRDHAAGKAVASLTYEAYPAMAEKKMLEIANEASRRWPVLGLAIEHRIGPLALGDIAVGVAVSAAHRDAAFEAGRYLIDTIKEVVPIWKKEFTADGAVWVDPSIV